MRARCSCRNIHFHRRTDFKMSLRDLLIINLTLRSSTDSFRTRFSPSARQKRTHWFQPPFRVGVLFTACFTRKFYLALCCWSLRWAAARVISNKSNDCDRFGLHVRCCGFSMAALNFDSVETNFPRSRKLSLSSTNGHASSGSPKHSTRQLQRGLTNSVLESV